MSNQIFIFPTDTVYGIGAKLYDLASLNLIYELKKRPHNIKIAVLISKVEQINLFGQLNETAIKLINNYFPGPLTIIIKSNEKYINAYGEDTVGVRMPSNIEALDLINREGPLKTTSVNYHNELPLNDLYQIKEKFISPSITYIENSNNNDLINLASTVIDVTDPNNIKLIREGIIKISNILEYLQL